MDKARLMEVLNRSTCLISKGDTTQRKLPGIPVLLWGLLMSSDSIVDNFQKVDCHFITVGVNAEQAESDRKEFVEILSAFPEPRRLQEGPSYKHMADVVGDEMTALRVFGLGKALGLWDVLLPDQFGFPDHLADEAAELGLIVATGYAGTLSQPVQSAFG